MRTYQARRVNHDAECWVEMGRVKMQLQPDESLKLRNHSPDGFEFGYEGSGPAQLALAILLDHCRANELPDTLALAHYQEFKREFIAKMGLQEGVVLGGQIKHFLEQQTNNQNAN